MESHTLGSAFMRTAQVVVEKACLDSNISQHTQIYMIVYTYTYMYVNLTSHMATGTSSTLSHTRVLAVRTLKREARHTFEKLPTAPREHLPAALTQPRPEAPS